MVREDLRRRCGGVGESGVGDFWGAWWGRIVREQGVAQAGGGERGCKPTLVGGGEQI